MPIQHNTIALLSWSSTESRQAASHVDVINLLVQLDQLKRPTLVDVLHEDTENLLTISVAAKEHCMTFMLADNEPPYFTTADGKSDKIHEFYYMEAYTEFAFETGISIIARNEAVKLFLDAGDKPNNVKWFEV